MWVKVLVEIFLIFYINDVFYSFKRWCKFLFWYLLVIFEEKCGIVFKFLVFYNFSILGVLFLKFGKERRKVEFYIFWDKEVL